MPMWPPFQDNLGKLVQKKVHQSADFNEARDDGMVVFRRTTCKSFALCSR